MPCAVPRGSLPTRVDTGRRAKRVASECETLTGASTVERVVALRETAHNRTVGSVRNRNRHHPESVVVTPGPWGSYTIQDVPGSLSGGLETAGHRSETCRHSSAAGSRNRYRGGCRSTANTRSSTTSRRPSVRVPRQSGPRLVTTRYGGPGTGSASIPVLSALAPVVSTPSSCAASPRSRSSASKGRRRRSPSVTGRRSTADATAAPTSTTAATVSRCSSNTCSRIRCTCFGTGARRAKTCRAGRVV